MQIAIISDIHGNAVALDAVRADLDNVNPDRIVCLGDVATGPQPSEALGQVQRLGCPVVMGNADEGLIDPQSFAPQTPEDADEDLQRIMDIGEWCTEQLSEDHLGFLRSFAPTVTMELDDRTEMLCYHGSPQSYSERIDAMSSETTLSELFADVEATVFAGGHTHDQFFRRYKDSIVLNPGSVGMAYEEDRATNTLYNPPWAEYALVTRTNGSLHVELRRTEFDTDEFVRATRESGMPHTEWYTKDW